MPFANGKPLIRFFYLFLYPFKTLAEVMMNHSIKIVFLVFFCFAFSGWIFSQENKQKSKKEQKEQQQHDQDEECEVLLLSIAENYVGDCKRGLAHGKGKADGVDIYEGEFKKGYPHGTGLFQYDNGDVYSGHLKKGLKDGEGTLFTKIEDRDTVLTGIWIDDVYVGPKPKHPQVLYKYGVDSHSFRNVREGNRFLIDIYLNGLPNTDMENFTIISTSGTEFQMGRSFGFENVDFPVVCKVSYYTWNKLRTARHQAIFEFKLEEPGDWLVKIIN